MDLPSEKQVGKHVDVPDGKHVGVPVEKHLGVTPMVKQYHKKLPSGNKVKGKINVAQPRSVGTRGTRATGTPRVTQITPTPTSTRVPTPPRVPTLPCVRTDLDSDENKLIKSQTIALSKHPMVTAETRRVQPSRKAKTMTNYVTSNDIQ